MADQELVERARALLDLCRTKKLKIAAAESCTGGLLAATLTEVPGSSDVFERGFVTYSDEAKTADAMARGALAHAPVDLTVSITGIAGPHGAVPGKPVGLVHFAAASRSGRLIGHDRNYGDIGRARVRRASVIEALALLQELAETEQLHPVEAAHG